MNTFESDGYQDGFAGLQASPPAPYSFAGNVTTVFASEYLQGWVRGRHDRRNIPASMIPADRFISEQQDSLDRVEPGRRYGAAQS